MVGEGARKRDLLVEIRPDETDVRIHKVMRLVYPLASSLAISATAFIFYLIYDGEVPLEMLFLLALLVPMAMFAYIFSMAISTPFASPITVFTEGIEFRSTWLGAKMGLPGLIPKDEIDRIELVAHEGKGKGKAVIIVLKNKRSRWSIAGTRRT